MDIMTGELTKLYFYESRLETFKGWPFEEDCSCTPENVSYFTLHVKILNELIKTKFNVSVAMVTILLKPVT